MSSCKTKPHPKHLTLLMIGLDNAGKTKILIKVQPDNNILSRPTLGFNVGNFERANTHFTLWDIGGHIKPLWKSYYPGCQGLIFVVDSCDYKRIGEARVELLSALAEKELKDVPVLVFANKQDMENAMTLEQIKNELNLESINDRQWIVTMSSGITGDGLSEGLIWLDGNSKKQKTSK